MLPPSMSALPYMHYHKPSFPRTDKTWPGALGCGIVALGINGSYGPLSWQIEPTYSRI